MPPLGWKKATAEKLTKHEIERRYRSKPEVKARLAAKKRELRARNPEKYRLSVRKYQEAHKDELRNKLLEKRGANPEIHREKNRESYEKFKESRLQKMKEWRKKQPPPSACLFPNKSCPESRCIPRRPNHYPIMGQGMELAGDCPLLLVPELFSSVFVCFRAHDFHETGWAKLHRKPLHLLQALQQQQT